MKRGKRLLSLIMSMAVIITMLAALPVNSYADIRSGTTGDLTWTLDSATGVFTLSGNGRGANYENNSNNRAPWYSYRSEIRSLDVKDGVIQVGSYSFYNCTNLASVSFANSVDTIGYCCFRSCSSLVGARLPSGCSWYYKEIFLNCRALKWCILPDNNYTNDYSGRIPDGTFSACPALEEVYVGPGITGLDQKAFYGCTSLKGIIWAGSGINSVGTDAFNNVPSSCRVTGPSGISSQVASVGLTYMPLSGTCSANSHSVDLLTYTLNPNNRQLSFSGSGDMNSNPWSVYHYLLDSVNFSQVDGSYSINNGAFQGAGIDHIVFDTSYYLEIHNNAFADCTRTTYWLNIPAGTAFIGSGAFANTGFNYVTFATESVDIANDSFNNSGYARYFAIPGSGVKAFVDAGKALGYPWFLYCLNDNHTYTTTTTAPTCTEKGYDTYSCINCDADSYRSNYTQSLGHSYSCTSISGANFIYECTRCGAVNLTLDAASAGALFEPAISHENDNAPYHQSNYNGAVDVYKDGYVNAKDFILISDTLHAASTNGRKTILYENTKYQTVDGFGASGCWWAQDIGGWSNLDDIMELLYSEENGIGLDIYRYNLGAGSNNDPQLYEVGKRARCFLLSNGTYDWNNDPNAMNALASARSFNNDLKVTLFCNSPPVSMTINGKAYCSMNSDTNIYESDYQAFTNFVLTCAQHFIDEGYNVTEVSPINEPEWGWACWQNGDGTYSMNQEGCHWTDENARKFYNNYFIPSLASNSSLNGRVGVSVWESGQMNHNDYWNGFMNKLFSSDSSYASGNANIRGYVDSLDVHSYWASENDRTTVASQLNQSAFSSISKVRCSEYCQMTNDGSTGVYDLIQQEGGSTNGMTIDYGIALADIIYQDMTILNAVEWDWWTACGYGIYPDSLLYLDRYDHSNLMPSKRLWALGNYSKFIDVGARRIRAVTENNIPDTVRKSAYLNPDGSVVVVYVNKTTANQYTCFDGAAYNTLESYVTDATRDLAKVQSAKVNGTPVILPARSVTTVVLHK